MSNESPPRPLVLSSDLSRQQRIPPGQSETKKWPVLHYGDVPATDLATWDFSLVGLVEREWRCDWKQFRSLPWIDVRCDIHCVTRWSRLNNVFSGPSVRTVLQHAAIKPEARAVLIHAEGGFTTNLPLEDFLGEDCLFAIEHDGQPLTPDHGFPLRLVIPRLYFWKSAKWVRGVEFQAKEEPGFWESNGYHIRGDPWTEERHSW